VEILKRFSVFSLRDFIIIIYFFTPRVSLKRSKIISQIEENGGIYNGVKLSLIYNMRLCVYSSS
jgi:hypothetical protein